MKLTDIEIKNFRGIKHAVVNFPQDSRIICLIGAGDSGKSTLLTAIEWALWPSWSLIATDTDFYNFCEWLGVRYKRDGKIYHNKLIVK
jgi:predicted ATP-dependent endonuclease of OLD family